MALMISVADVTTYMVTRPNSSSWTALNAADKTAHVTTAENQLALYYELDATEQTHLNAIAEQTLFISQTGAGADQRAALQAMGVYETTVTDEKLRKNEEVPICAYAKKALASVKINEERVFVNARRLERDDTDYGT